MYVFSVYGEKKLIGEVYNSPENLSNKVRATGMPRAAIITDRVGPPEKRKCKVATLQKSA